MVKSAVRLARALPTVDPMVARLLKIASPTGALATTTHGSQSSDATRRSGASSSPVPRVVSRVESVGPDLTGEVALGVTIGVTRGSHRSSPDPDHLDERCAGRFVSADSHESGPPERLGRPSAECLGRVARIPAGDVGGAVAEIPGDSSSGIPLFTSIVAVA